MKKCGIWSKKFITEMTCLCNLVEVEFCTTLYTLVFENGLVNGTETKVSGNKRITRRRGIKV